MPYRAKQKRRYRMKLNIAAIIATATSAWYAVKRYWDAVSKIVEPLVLEVEAMAQDGLIDKADRKALVLKAIELLEQDGKIKLNPITRLIVGKVVDKIAKKLPDFKVSKGASEILGKAKELIN
jgi:hypothetical protein